MKIFDIPTIESAILSGRVGEIKFTIADDNDSSLPVVDVSVKDKDGVEIFGDLNFYSLAEAMSAIEEGLERHDST